MPFILRKVRKRRWDRNKHIPWLTKGDMPAEPLLDLATKSNGLSVWYIKDDRSNLKQIVTALAATRDHVAIFDYALFDQQILCQVGIEIQETKGDTPCAEANSWHRDLVHLSARKLIELAREMWRNVQTDRKSKVEIQQLLVEAVASGRIDQERLKSGIRDKVCT